MSLSAIILAGGRGTRIAHLNPDMPKPLVPVLGRPFLDWVLLYLLRQGIGRFVVCAGYQADRIEAWAAAWRERGRDVVVEAEVSPLGTGGAIMGAMRHCGDWFLALNGDGLTISDLQPLLALTGTPGLAGAIVARPIEDAARYGSIAVDATGRIKEFRVKVPGPALVSTGIYLLSRAALEPFRRLGQVSIEYETFPAMLATGLELRALDAGDVPFIDIGMPETLGRADRFVTDNRAAFAVG